MLSAVNTSGVENTMTLSCAVKVPRSPAVNVLFGPIALFAASRATYITSAPSLTSSQSGLALMIPALTY